MSEDTNGFLYPQIQTELCVDCGLCVNSCAFGKSIKTEMDPLVFAARLEDVDERMRSQSGGAFWALARQIISSKGVIYGAGMANDLTVRHMRAETIEELEPLRQSKYVQSDTNDTFSQAKNDLEHGRKVLFSGTPCQVAGLNAYLEHYKTDRAGCLTVDLICFGIPSPKLYQDYVAFLSQKYLNVSCFVFRDKTYQGWHTSVEKIVFSDGKYMKAYHSNDYLNLFYSRLALRPTCTNCLYAQANRCSDITLGDYWGIEEAHPDFWDETGVSVVMLNTHKGHRLFQEIEELAIMESSFSLASKEQPGLRGGFPPQPAYDAFWKLYHEEGFAAATRKYCRNTPIKKGWVVIKKILKKILPPMVVHKIKEIMKR